MARKQPFALVYDPEVKRHLRTIGMKYHSMVRAMLVASVADVKTHFSAYLKASEQKPVVVTRNGKPVAVLVAVGDEEELERLMLAHSPRIRAILEAARLRIRRGAGVRHEDFWKEMEGGRASKKRSGGRRKTA